MIQEFRGLNSEEIGKAVYAFVRRASPQKIIEIIASMGGGFNYDPNLTKQRDLVNFIINGNGSEEFYNSKPNDDRMDVCDLGKPSSARWKNFTRTYAGRKLSSKTYFLENVEKTVQSVAAIARRCHFEDFANNRERTLEQIIATKFSKKKYVNKFGDQTCLARGTAFYIGKNLLLTAAHNLQDDKGFISNEDLVYIFDYSVLNEQRMPKRENVAAYMGEVVCVGEGMNDDWAVVRLGAELKNGNGVPLSSRPPLKLSANQNHPKRRQGCYSVGFSMGVPMKLSLVGHHIHKLLGDRFAVNLDMFHGNSGSPVLNIQTNEVIGLFVAGFPDLVEIGDEFIGLRQYRYVDIAKNRGGEHCQLIGRILPKIKYLLERTNPIEEVFSFQNSAVAGNTNYPYSYIHKEESGKYLLSILIDSVSKYEIVNDLNRDLSQTVRQIMFKKLSSNGIVATPPYPITYQKRGTYAMVLTYENGEQRKTQLELDTASDWATDFKENILYIPHIYLVHYISDGAFDYQLFVKIPANGYGFSVTKSDDSSSFTFEENTACSFQEKYWSYESSRFRNGAGAQQIIIEVYDQNLTPKGKGTIRHSAADNKPFDLLTCD